MLYSERKDCGVEGCTQKQYQGKAFCGKHLNTHGKTVMTKQTQSLIRSSCCEAPCTVGKKHEYGMQYCDKCGQMCVWKVATVS